MDCNNVCMGIQQVVVNAYDNFRTAFLIFIAILFVIWLIREYGGQILEAVFGPVFRAWGKARASWIGRRLGGTLHLLYLIPFTSLMYWIVKIEHFDSHSMGWLGTAFEWLQIGSMLITIIVVMKLLQIGEDDKNEKPAPQTTEVKPERIEPTLGR
jgi:hypothetical protein